MEHITMRKALVFLALGTVCLFAACSDPAGSSSTAAVIYVTDVSLNETELTLIVGDTADLIPTVSPNDAANQNVTWVSSDEAIARVDNGHVTAIDIGTAIITVTTEDSNFTAKCTIIVEADPEAIAVTGVILDKNKLTLSEGDAGRLTATVEPEDAAYRNVTWASSDNDIATVDSGIVTAIAVGEATITVTTRDGGFMAECTVTVEAADPDAVAVTGVSLNKTALTLKMEETETLHASIEPEDATNQNVIWSSSNDAVARVDNNGLVTAVALGTATITVTTENNAQKAECIVTVNPIPVDRVELNKDGLEVNGIQPPIFLTATVYPPNATNKKISWSSSADTVATVEATTGNESKVTFVGSGSVTITVTTEDGEKTDTCSIIVKPVDPIGVALKTDLPLYQREKETLIVTFNPTFATDRRVTWASSNNNVASVDENGLVTAIAEGTAIITVTTQKDGHTASCTVKVEPVLTPASGVTLDESAITLIAGETRELIATVEPEDATNKHITWSSSNAAVASVDAGVVTAKADGTVTITATTNDGGFKAACTVTVIVPVSGVTLDESAITLIREQTRTLTASIQPEGVTNNNVTWDSDDKNVATVSANGLVTATGAGTATITVTTADGNKTAICAVTVNPKTYTVTFNRMDGNTSSVTVDEWTTVAAPIGIPNKNEYNGKFDAWYKESQLTNEWDFAEDTVDNGNITLYAKWRPYELKETGPGGGKIFYRDDEGFTVTYDGSIAHYLEMAPSHVPSDRPVTTANIAWISSSAFQSTNVGGTETGIGTGRKNTALIVAVDTGTAAYAARSCANYNENTNDWFLPSTDELRELLSVNGGSAQQALGLNNGNNTSGRYWSSSQASNTQVYIRNLSGVQSAYTKSAIDYCNARPIRAF